MTERADQPGSGNRETAADSAFPSEPFPCPACAQMLAPSCRVCVACKQPIDPAQIRRRRAVIPTLESQARLPTTARVQFPWQLFFALLVVRLLVAIVAQRHWGLIKAELALGSVEILSAVWVFYDAHEKRVSKPLRWGLGSLLLWIVFFPWYLARRRDPGASCPFVEAEASPFLRVLLFVLLVFVLLSAAFALMKVLLPK